jgi:hypothetical protein
MTLSPADPFAFNMSMGFAWSLAMAASLSEAIAITREVINKHPEVTWSYRMLASWSAMGGDLKTARCAAQRLLAAEPRFTIEWYRARPLFQDMPHWADQMAGGLRRAGLPDADCRSRICEVRSRPRIRSFGGASQCLGRGLRRTTAYRGPGPKADRLLP